MCPSLAARPLETRPLEARPIEARPIDGSRPPPAPAPQERSPADGLRVSEEAYWRDYYLVSDIHYEWNGGLLEEKPVSDYETYLVYAWFTRLLQHFLDTRPIARMVALEMGFRLTLPTGTVIRKPDFGVVLADNPQPLLPLDVSYHGVFDLCVEALSDHERRGIERDTVTKKAEYAAGGVPEYYILHRDPARQAFLTRTPVGLYVPITPTDGVICSKILPGLRFRLTDLCDQPTPEALRADPVYADFMLPGWLAAERRAEVQTQRADAEQERADAEARARQEAERRAETEAQGRRAAEQALAELQAQLAGRRQS